MLAASRPTALTGPVGRGSEGETLQGTRFGLPGVQRDAFVAAYGRDIRSWDGYPVLRDIRELTTLTALLRDGHIDTGARRQLQIRLRSLRTGDQQQWTPF